MKYSRLLVGLIVLFSIFLFMGTEGGHGCTQCEEESFGGALTVINNTYEKIRVYVEPLGGNAGLREGGTHVFYLNEGLYHVVAIEAVPVWGRPTKVFGARMIEIKLGSNKTVTFTFEKKGETQ